MHAVISEIYRLITNVSSFKSFCLCCFFFNRKRKCWRKKCWFLLTPPVSLVGMRPGSCCVTLLTSNQTQEPLWKRNRTFGERYRVLWFFPPVSVGIVSPSTAGLRRSCCTVNTLTGVSSLLSLVAQHLATWTSVRAPLKTPQPQLTELLLLLCRAPMTFLVKFTWNKSNCYM